MARYLLLNDFHLSDRAPSSCTDSYTDDLFEMAEEISLIAKQQNVDALVQAGDFFHIKTPSRTSHALVLRAIEWMRDSGLPLLIVPGNHDLSHDRLDSIEQTQPLGLMFAAGAIKLDGWHSEFPHLYGVPWQQDWESPNTLPRVFRGWVSSAGSSDLVVTHCPLYPPGQELPWEHVLASDVAAAMGGVGNVLYGHIHDYHGVYEVGGVSFCNVGALSRGSLHESDLTRKIYVTLWDTDTAEFELIDVPHKPGHEIFRVQEKAEIKDAEAKLDEFLSSVGQTSVQVASIEQLISHISSLDVPTEVRQLAITLLQEVT